MYIFIIVFILPFLITIKVLQKSTKVAIETRVLTNKEEKEIGEEMMIHQALERIGAMPSHHHKEEHLQKENHKKVAIYTHNLLYLLGYSIIVVEIWYLYILLSNLISH